MRLWRRQTGQRGEQLAVEYLRQQGYRIQQQNYRCREGEIDIVARDGQTVVFVEVKTKRQAVFGPPQAIVDRRKQQKIVRVAMVYVHQHHLRNIDLRFDVVAVMLRPDETWEITHIPAAFGATEHFLY